MYVCMCIYIYIHNTYRYLAIRAQAGRPWAEAPKPSLLAECESGSGEGMRA